MITLKRKTRRPGLKILALFMLAIVFASAYWVYPWLCTRFLRTTRLIEWLRYENNHPEWAVQAGERCGEAPFLLPTSGLIGFLWGDAFRPGHRHQGIDIFGGKEPGVTPVVAAYPGYLSRLPEWKSSLIIRIPQDPLHPSRQIWTYYTHLADAAGNSMISSEFPPGVEEVFVDAGTLLGYQGNYSGEPFNPVGVHLHFSIVLDRGTSPEYPLGRFLNELDIQNTLDPSSYFGLSLNAAHLKSEVVICEK